MWMVSASHAGGHHASRYRPCAVGRAHTRAAGDGGGLAAGPSRAEPPAPLAPQPAAPHGLGVVNPEMPGILVDVRAHEVSPAFVGREAELAVLADACDRARAGAPGAVLVGGEAGGGKTRLVGEFADRVHGEALVLTGGCLQLSTVGFPYAPFTAALR